MATLFTRIINGEIGGRFIWSDEVCVAFLTIEPVRPGHTLVVPRVEVDHWVDLEASTAAHCFDVAQVIGRAQRQAFNPQRIGLQIQGFEVPHAHLHVWPSLSPADFDLSLAAPATDDALDEAAALLRLHVPHTPPAGE
ncbi:MAG: HIT family protein [Beutenbergiaceae bacterium]